MSTAPTSGRATFSWNPETVKTNIKQTTNPVLDKANSVAKTAIDPVAKACVEQGTKVSGEVLKQAIETSAPEGLKPPLKTSVDTCVIGVTNAVKDTITPKINNCLDSTTAVAKNSLNKTTDFSVDGAHKISQRVISFSS